MCGQVYSGGKRLFDLSASTCPHTECADYLVLHMEVSLMLPPRQRLHMAAPCGWRPWNRGCSSRPIPDR